MPPQEDPKTSMYQNYNDNIRASQWKRKTRRPTFKILTLREVGFNNLGLGSLGLWPWAARHDQNIDVFLTNEDWLKNGENRINGGVIMARNSKWSEDMFLGSR